MPFRIGPLELVIVLVIVLIIFGVGKLPQIGDALGKAIHQFRSSQSGKDESAAETDYATKTESEPK